MIYLEMLNKVKSPPMYSILFRYIFFIIFLNVSCNANNNGNDNVAFYDTAVPNNPLIDSIPAVPPTPVNLAVQMQNSGSLK